MTGRSQRCWPIRQVGRISSATHSFEHFLGGVNSNEPFFERRTQTYLFWVTHSILSTFLSWSLKRALFWALFWSMKLFDHFFEDSKKWICSQECFFEWVYSFEGFFECSKKRSRSSRTFMCVIAEPHIMMWESVFFFRLCSQKIANACAVSHNISYSGIVTVLLTVPNS